MKNEIFSLERIIKSFDIYPVLNGITLRLYQGETVFIGGPSDSEKSVLVDIMTGVSQPDCGSIYHHGKHTHFKSYIRAYKSGIHCIRSDAELFENLTVSENICLTKPRGMFIPFYTKKMNIIAKTICVDLDMNINYSKNVMSQKLSPPDKIMIRAMRSLYQQADLILFENVLHLFSNDEMPRFIKLINRLKNKGITVCIFDSMIERAPQIADRTIFIRDGLIAADFNNCAYTQKEEKILMHNSSLNTFKEIMPLHNRIASTSLDAMPVLFYGSEGKICSAEINRSEILGLFFSNPHDFYETLSSFKDEDKLCKLNVKSNFDISSTTGRNFSVLTPRVFSGENFPFMPCLDNVLLPTLTSHENGFKSFFASYPSGLRHAFCGLTSLDEKFWNQFAMKFTRYEQLEMVLYRYLAVNRPVLILVTLFSESNANVKELLLKFLDNATARGKRIIIVEKEQELLKSICDRTLDVSNL